MSKKEFYARIIPTPSDGDHPSQAMGTEVMVGDQKLKGVTSITLVADIHDPFWRATIECMVQPTEITALAAMHRPTLWQRIKRWYRDLPPAGRGPG